MKKEITSVLAALGFCLCLASCGEPTGDHTQPEATSGDYIRNDDIDTIDMAGTDTARIDNTKVDNVKTEEY
ncbi:hypothetical protein [Botryobacter ruber]|uniref:hypothetical protein n=1 Tax=Botryobacter ruber TaxID=2171629 RepID=UPI000F6524D2|nr:hypothetical protein [Botryobacter ruber]